MLNQNAGEAAQRQTKSQEITERRTAQDNDLTKTETQDTHFKGKLMRG